MMHGKHLRRQLTSLIVAMVMVFGCANGRLTLHDWQDLPEAAYTIPPYAQELARYKIALDPGHGGMAHLAGFKRGPSGAREAEMNLSVALFLREFLQRAGVEVFLTREDDSFVSLRDRADSAAQAGCDFLISLHHNYSKKPKSNFAAVFYHLTPDTQPFAMDLARNIYFGLVDALRLPEIIPDGLLPDKLIYPDGFGLLRRAKIPAILLESSFYSNRAEERRLTDKRYNRREAYGIFLGLARWAAGGVPATRMIRPAGISQSKRPQIIYEINDGITERSNRNLPALRIFGGSVSATIDGSAVRPKLSDDKRMVSFQPDSALANGYHFVRVDAQNMFKNHNLPHVDTLLVAAPVDTCYFTAPVTSVPADSQAVIPLRFAFLDIDRQPVWDGTHVTLRASGGAVMPESPRLKNGRATVYFRSTPDTGAVRIFVTADDYADTLRLFVQPPGDTYIVTGHVRRDSAGSPLVDAQLFLSDSLWTTTDENGFFYLLNPPKGRWRLAARKDGFFDGEVAIEIDPRKSQRIAFHLQPVLDGILHQQVLILDAAAGRYDDANLALATRLASALKHAGAKPVMIRNDQNEISLKRRIDMVNRLPEGWYLKLLYEKGAADARFVQTTIYPANREGELLARAINASFALLPGVRTELRQKADVPEVRLTNKTAVEVKLRFPQPQPEGRDLIRLFQGIVSFRKALMAEEKRDSTPAPGEE